MVNFVMCILPQWKKKNNNPKQNRAGENQKTPDQICALRLTDSNDRGGEMPVGARHVMWQQKWSGWEG